jgi:hypothetical protein
MADMDSGFTPDSQGDSSIPSSPSSDSGVTTNHCTQNWLMMRHLPAFSTCNHTGPVNEHPSFLAANAAVPIVNEQLMARLSNTIAPFKKPSKKVCQLLSIPAQSSANSSKKRKPRPRLERLVDEQFVMDMFRTAHARMQNGSHSVADFDNWNVNLSMQTRLGWSCTALKELRARVVQGLEYRQPGGQKKLNDKHFKKLKEEAEERKDLSVTDAKNAIRIAHYNQCIMEDVSYKPLSQSCVNTTYKRMTFTERASQSGQTLARYNASRCVKAFVATAAVNEVREKQSLM